MKIVHLRPPTKPTDPGDDPCGDPWDKQSPSLRDGQSGDPATRGPGVRARGRAGPNFQKSLCYDENIFFFWNENVFSCCHKHNTNFLT